MTKLRVHELAKELNISNNEIKAILGKNGIEIKSHMSAVDENMINIVKKACGTGTKKADAPAAKPVPEKKPEDVKAAKTAPEKVQKEIPVKEEPKKTVARNDRPATGEANKPKQGKDEGHTRFVRDDRNRNNSDRQNNERVRFNNSERMNSDKTRFGDKQGNDRPRYNNDRNNGDRVRFTNGDRNNSDRPRYNNDRNGTDRNNSDRPRYNNDRITMTEITLTDQDTIIPVTEIILTDRDLTMTEMVRTEEDSLTMAVVVRIVADFPETEIVRAASTSRSSVTGRITETTGSTITETILRWDSARMTRMIIIIREEVQEQIPVRILKQKRCRARI